jgi:hypothetical protein
MNRDSREEIASTIADMLVINHHEHSWHSFSVDYGQEFDLPSFLYLDYLGQADLAAAGFPEAPELVDYLSNPQIADGAEKAWKAIRPFLDRVRSTSYFRYLLRGLNDLFGITEDDVFSERWREASERMRRYSREQKGKGSELCKRMRVVATVLDARSATDRLQYLAPGDHRILHVAFLDGFIHEERGLAETLDKYPRADFEHWLAAFDGFFHRTVENGAAGFKSGLAYNRRIEYSDPSKDDAARVFRSGLLTASPAEKAIYQDYMVNRLCRLCVEADVPLQIHTGIQTHTEHVLEDARPTLLTGLFRRHGDLRVDLFHGGYPWCVHAGLMAKYFPNVYIDGCWLHHISPSAYRAALTSWIETVPMNKIFAWGGDHSSGLEHSYASLVMARELVVDVLADLVDRGYFDVDLALLVARRIFHDNGFEFWRLAGADEAKDGSEPVIRNSWK